MQTKLIPCPTCQTLCEYKTSNPFRPFCSDSCKNKDILAWAEEKYAVAGKEASPEEYVEEMQKKIQNSH